MSDIDLVASLHENPTFLPPEQIRQSTRQILLILLVLFGFNAAFLLLFRSLRWFHVPKKSNDQVATEEHKAAYRAVSLIMNSLLGATGMYHFFVNLPASATITERIEGYDEMAVFAYLQIAYNLWAILMGTCFVPEPVEMLFHHVGVIVVGLLSAFFTNGFRYHNPFFFGLIETSSVPLVLMNTFKDYPMLVDQFPIAHALILISFAVSFISTRVLMWLSEAMDFIRLAAMMCYTCAGYLGKIGLGFSIVSCVFLTTLQLFWAGKIVRAALAIVAGSKKTKGTKAH